MEEKILICAHGKDERFLLAHVLMKKFCYILNIHKKIRCEKGSEGIELPGQDSKADTMDDIEIKTSSGAINVTPPVADGKGGITVPGGNIIATPDGDYKVPEGEKSVTVYPDGTIIKPNNTVINPDGGTVIIPGSDGSGTEVIPPDGSIVKPDGSIVTPEGPIINPDGTNRQLIQARRLQIKVRLILQAM